jgi:cobalt/nickel transport system permease protein
MHPPPHALDRIDPRARILALAAFVAMVAFAHRPVTLALALGLSLALALGAMGPGEIFRRLAALNLFLLLVSVLLPLTTGGESLGTLGPLRFSREGVELAAAVVLKGNAIVLALAALLGTLDLVTLGHALAHLYVPLKLIHLLLFTVRYVEVLRREYLRLTVAMRLRAFRPRMDRHTYRTYGYLVGMLLVRSLDRAERIVAAMKCRGFRGRFYLLDHFAFSRYDAAFGVCLLSLLTILMLAECL